MDSNFLAENIYFLRKKMRVTQADLALQVKKGQTTIGNWENGVSQPNVEELVFLSKFFGVSIDALIGVNLEKGNPIEKTDVAENSEKSNLKGNPNGNLNTEMQLIYTEKEEDESNQVAEINAEYKGYPRVITIDTAGEENATFIPVKARAGYLSTYGDAQFLGKLKVYKIIGDRNKSYRIWEVEGNSMFPTLHDKDTVDAYWVPVSEIRDDRIHVIVTRNDGILIKRVLNRYKDGVLICKSDNTDKGEYPPIVLPIHDVVEVWYVEKATTHNLARPGEIYKRIQDLEANMAIIMHNAGLLKAPENQTPIQSNPS